MKKIILIIGFILSFNINASTNTENNHCDTVSKMAYEIMISRQNHEEITLEMQINMMNQYWQGNNESYSLAKNILENAYNIPVFKSERSKETISQSFKEKVFDKCLKGEL